MLTLKIQTDGPVPGQSVDLVDPLITAGRHPDNTLCIEDDNTSAYHAKLEMLDGDRYTITDLDSLNGTFVNDRRVRTAVVKHGDTLKIGRLCALIADQSRNGSKSAAAVNGKGSNGRRPIQITRLSPPDVSASGGKVPVAALKPAEPAADGDTDFLSSEDHSDRDADTLELQEARAAASEAERQRDAAVEELQRVTDEAQQQSQQSQEAVAQLEAARQALAGREAEFEKSAAADAEVHKKMLAAVAAAERERDVAVEAQAHVTEEAQQQIQEAAAQLEDARKALAGREAEFDKSAAADAEVHKKMLAAVAAAEQERDAVVEEQERVILESQQQGQDNAAQLEAALQALAERDLEIEKMAVDVAAARERIDELNLVIEMAQDSPTAVTGQADTDSPDYSAILSRLAKEERRTLEQAKLLIDRRRAVEAAEQSRDAATGMLQQTVAELEAAREALAERQIALSRAESRIAEFEGASTVTSF